MVAGTLSLKRNSFRARSIKNAELKTKRTTNPKKDISKHGAKYFNAAMPHRVPFKYLKLRITEHMNTGDDKVLKRWVGRMLSVHIHKANSLPVDERKRAAEGRDATKSALKEHIKHKTNDTAQTLLNELNSLPSNVPDFGPQIGGNNAAGPHIQLNAQKQPDSSYLLSPGSMAGLENTPRPGIGVAATPNGTNILTTNGEALPPLQLPPAAQTRIHVHGLHASKKYDPSKKW